LQAPSDIDANTHDFNQQTDQSYDRPSRSKPTTSFNLWPAIHSIHVTLRTLPGLHHVLPPHPQSAQRTRDIHPMVGQRSAHNISWPTTTHSTIHAARILHVLSPHFMFVQRTWGGGGRWGILPPSHGQQKTSMMKGRKITRFNR
jgi:hypothetical protein